MAISKATSWDDLDWVDIDPYDIRYYWSLRDALFERVYSMPVTPAADNVVPANYRFTWSQAIWEAFFNRQYHRLFDANGYHKCDDCRLLVRLLGIVSQGFFLYGSATAFFPSYFPALSDYKQGGNIPFSGSYFSRRADTAAVSIYPTRSTLIDGDITVNWLKAMKLAIQSLRYVELRGCITVRDDYGNDTQPEYRNINGVRVYYDIGDVIDGAIANIQHRVIDSWKYNGAYIRWSLYQNDNYQNHVGAGIEVLDTKWKNQLNMPVDVYTHTSYYVHSKYFSDDTYYWGYGTDYGKDEVRFLVTVQPGDTIGNYLDNVDIYPHNVVLPADNERKYYDFRLNLLGDLGPHFNFKA